ncbi:MAG TPA: condensation domain-containing protein [Pseudonocardiaceae bacterium]|nr:condensation domain-containing protein [Pseudonocardiaceae bacterium]
MTSEPATAVVDELNDRVGQAVLAAVVQVAGASRIGPGDRFADLGVDSLLAMRILAHCWQSLDAELPLRLLRPSMTVVGFAAAIRAELGVQAPAVAQPAVPRRRDGAPAALSFAQRALLAHQAVVPDLPVYNVPMSLRLSGRLDEQRLRWALDRLVDRHEVLRCVVEPGSDGPVARVRERPAIPMGDIDLRELDEPSRERQAEDIVRRLATEPVDLAAGPLRVTLLRLGSDEHVLLLVLHHVVCDGWSLQVLVRDLTVLYRDGEAGLPRLTSSAVDLAERQRERLDQAERDRHGGYWRTTLDGTAELLALPTDRPRPPVREYRGDRLPLSFSAEETDRLRALAAAHGVTLFTVLCVGVAVLLHRHTGQDDLTIGVPVADRRHPGTQELVGYLVNTVPLRLRLAGDPRCGALLRRAHEELAGVAEHAELGLDGVIAATGVPNGPGYTPFLQVSLVLMTESGHLPVDIGPTLSRQDLPTGTTKFDLTWYLEEQDGGLRGYAEFALDVFNADPVAAMSRRLRVLLGSMAAGADRISQLSIFDRSEQIRTTAGVPGRNTEAEPWQPVSVMFDRQARARPDRIALWQPAGGTGYGELRVLVDQLTGALLARGVAVEQLIAVCLPPTAGRLAAVLAVLRAGAAVVPVPDTISTERLGELLGELGITVLIAEGRPGLPDGVLLVEATSIGESAESVSARPVFAEQLAGVLPVCDLNDRVRRVELTHRGLANLVTAAGAMLGVDGDTRLLCSADADLWTGLLALCHNATLCPAADPADLEQSIVESKADLVLLPPDVLDSVDPAAVPGVRTVVAEGGLVSGALRDRWATRARFFVAHESTAATFVPMLTRCETGAAATQAPGRPIDNVRLAVLDERLDPVPDGVVGRLHIAGLALGRGFREQPGATAELFLPDPHAVRPGTRIYRTGDLVRRVGSGLVFVGRADRRIVLRGQQVDLDEVAAALHEGAGGRRATVGVEQGPAGRPQLVGYLVTEPNDAAVEAPVDTESLRRRLLARRPRHLVPSVIRVVSARAPIAAAADPLPPDDEGAPDAALAELLARVERLSEDEARAHLAGPGAGVEPPADGRS